MKRLILLTLLLSLALAALGSVAWAVGDQQAFLAVTGLGKNVVYTYDSTGNLVQQINDGTWLSGATFYNGSLLVNRYNGGETISFQPDAGYRTTDWMYGSYPYVFGVGVDASRNLYVATGYNTISYYPGTGAVPGPATNGWATTAAGARGLAISANGHIWVACNDDMKVQEFANVNGVSQLVGTYNVDNPFSITAASNGDVYVSSGAKVLKFNGTGFEDYLVSNQIESVLGLAYGADGNLYVGNHGGVSNSQYGYKIYKYDGQNLSTFLNAPAEGGYYMIAANPRGMYNPVPEPGSILTLGTGLFGILGYAIRRRK